MADFEWRLYCLNLNFRPVYGWVTVQPHIALPHPNLVRNPNWIAHHHYEAWMAILAFPSSGFGTRPHKDWIGKFNIFLCILDLTYLQMVVIHIVETCNIVICPHYLHDIYSCSCPLHPTHPTAIAYVSQVAIYSLINAFSSLLHKNFADMDLQRNKILVKAKIILTSVRDYQLFSTMAYSFCRWIRCVDLAILTNTGRYRHAKSIYNHLLLAGVNDQKNAIEGKLLQNGHEKVQIPYWQYADILTGHDVYGTPEHRALQFSD